jgi:hypothetical protein
MTTTRARLASIYARQYRQRSSECKDSYRTIGHFGRPGNYFSDFNAQGALLKGVYVHHKT